jgi:hypothetical protein
MKSGSFKRKPRLLYLSSILPDTSCGAHLAIYRHFVLRDDFEVHLASATAESNEDLPFTRIPVPPWLRRLQRSRLSRLAFNYTYLINWYFVPDELDRLVEAFQPDVVMGVPDNIHTGWLLQVAKKYNLPLITNFQDLFPESSFLPGNMQPFFWVRRFLTRGFRVIHRRSDLACYTSEGMMGWFDPHPNPHVLYPLGARQTLAADGPPREIADPVRLIYAGNCYGAYGRMLLRLAKCCLRQTEVQLEIYAIGRDWSDEDIEQMEEAGIYKGFLPFDELQQELQACDCFLTAMSFEEDDQSFVKTSFTTKWLDYAPFGKPVFNWSPPYASSSVFAREHRCAISTEEDDPECLLESIKSLRSDPKAWRQYSQAIAEVGKRLLDPDQIHDQFCEKVRELLPHLATHANSRD